MEIAQAFDFITELNDKYLKNNICQIGQYDELYMGLTEY